jgi:hypothetical protein
VVDPEAVPYLFGVLLLCGSSRRGRTSRRDDRFEWALLGLIIKAASSCKAVDQAAGTVRDLRAPCARSNIFQHYGGNVNGCKSKRGEART